MTERDYIINPYDIGLKTGLPWIAAGSDGFTLMRTMTQEERDAKPGSISRTVTFKGPEKGDRTWTWCVNQAKRVFGIDPDCWVMWKAWPGDWFPSVVTGYDLRNDKGRKLIWTEPGRGCTVTVMGKERFESSRTCGRFVVETVDGPSGHSFDVEDGQIHRCSMHQKSHAKAVERDRAWREKWDAEREADRRAEQTTRICEETLEKIRPLLAELGIHPDSLVVGNSGNRVGILFPAEVAELLTGKAIELEEITGGVL